MAKRQTPYAGKDVRDLTAGEWRVLMSWRMEDLEAKVDGLVKAAWSIVAAILIGVIVYALTTGTVGPG